MNAGRVETMAKRGAGSKQATTAGVIIAVYPFAQKLTLSKYLLFKTKDITRAATTAATW